jgi:hypothetical protein
MAIVSFRKINASKKFLKNTGPALVVWRSGHCIHLRNKKARVQIPSGYKVFREA